MFKQTLEQFRESHREVSAAEFMAVEDRPVDLEFYPACKAIHGYWREFEGGAMALFILESPRGFHWLFQHPADCVAPSLAEAEAELFDAMGE